MSRPKPKYVKRGGEQVYASPFVATGVEFFGFAVQADLNSLQSNICDHFLNEPLGAKNRFVPLSDTVLFVFNTIDSLSSATPPFNTMGWFPEKEAAIWVALVDREREQLSWFHPYMIVDISYAMAMGRELYGFPKTIGWHTIPNGPDAPATLSVETLTVKAFTPASEGRRETLFSAKQCSETKSHSELKFTNLRKLVEEIVRMLNIEKGIVKDLELDAHLIEDLFKLRMPMTFLKQFRDGADPSYACYQAMQEVNSRLTKLHDARIYRQKYEIEINNFDSHPIRADLGLSAGALAAKVAFWTRFDFEIGNCDVIQEITA